MQPDCIQEATAPTKLTEIAMPTTTPTAPGARELALLFAGGLAGLIAFEVFASLIAPLIMGGPLQPAGLVVALFKALFGVDPGSSVATLIHYATGIVGYPIAYWLFSRLVLGTRVIPNGIIWGVLTWILALGVLTTLAGLPFMLNFGTITWVSLAGHVAYGLVAVAVFELALARTSRAPTAQESEV